MSQPVISIENLSKSYQLGTISTGTLFRDLERWWAKKRGKPDPFRKFGEIDHGNREGETVWALKDINFTVEQGEALGIIGRNGAGKSTLLKILSQVTAPTEGVVKVKGRIASLLEVGTGFHGELTGRENIYLNGAINGMSRVEVKRKFDEIVDFSGVEKYIDTPVKRYSSGMYVRLAFAVAAHLDPEILIVDEVLAVGDADFQKKCLGKMDDVAQEGRTVLFVSHNMGMVKSLCRRAILLDLGMKTLDGDVSAVIDKYLTTDKSTPFEVNYSHQNFPPGDDYAVLLEAHIEDKNGKTTGEIDIRHPFSIKMKYEQKIDVPIAPYSNFHFYTIQGEVALISNSDRNSDAMKKGVYEVTCSIPGNFLNNKQYLIGLALTYTHRGIHVSFYKEGALSVIIHDPILETIDKERSGYSGTIPGVVRPRLKWKMRKIL